MMLLLICLYVQGEVFVISSCLSFFVSYIFVQIVFGVCFI